MTIEWAGLLFGVLTVLTIWAGHIMVRRLNYDFGTIPAIPMWISGGLIIGASFWVNSNLLSGALGIIGLTTIVDGVEILRQEERIRRGRAPENPSRPVKP